jgi:hypothetical protein
VTAGICASSGADVEPLRKTTYGSRGTRIFGYDEDFPALPDQEFLAPHLIAEIWFSLFLTQFGQLPGLYAVCATTSCQELAQRILEDYHNNGGSRDRVRSILASRVRRAPQDRKLGMWGQVLL